MAATARPDRPAGGSARDHALDAFRGIAIVGMVRVDLPGQGDAAYPQLAHAVWNGVTLADRRPWEVAVGALTPLALSPPAASLLFAILAGALPIGITFALKRRGRVLRM